MNTRINLLCRLPMLRVAVITSVIFSAMSLAAQAAVRVALLDFSTDDNSYRSIEAAAQFTSLVQIGLADERGVEWVERSQLRLAKTEFALAEMQAAGGTSPLRRGRMLGANWLVTGHFSTDDRERQTLSFQFIELEHADVIASDTVLLPDGAGGGVRFGTNQVESAVASLRRLLAIARANEFQATNQTRLAFLFFVDTSPFAFGRGPQMLARELAQALEQMTTTNRQLRLVKFPKAYQATEESELVMDGIIEAGQDSWRQTADLYVWGKYATTNTFAAGRRESRLEVELNLWDGAGQPVVVKESVLPGAEGEISAGQTSDLINRLAGRVLAGVRRAQPEQDSPAIRQEIAASIVKTYVGMTGRGQSQLGLDDREKFVEAVHMLETACFFNPDNADARVLWVTCRYGWWIDFDFNVKNQFWTKWRRSQAWGEYVDRFGLKPSKVPLPFPYHGPDGILESYVQSLEDVVKLFPQWDSVEEAVAETASEDQSRRQGVHTLLMEAEYHGFPKQMPPELTMKWKTEISNELAQRQKRIAEYSQAQANSTNTLPAIALRQSAGVISNQTGLTPQPKPPGALPVQRSSPGDSQMVASPAWLKNWIPLTKMFRLYPPNVLPVEVKPEIQVIQFPPRYEVKVIRQMEFQHGQVWILAMDECSAPSSAAKPDFAAERKDETGRLWILAEEGLQPALFKADDLPSSLNTMLFQSDRLWLGGDSVVALNLLDRSARKFGIADGLGLRDVEALTVAGNRVFAAGDIFKVMSFDPVSARWSNVPLPTARFHHGTGNQYALIGNGRWLGYVAGCALFHDFNRGTWTNLTQLDETVGFVPDAESFWAGGRYGLQRFDSTRQSIQNWNAPAFLESPMISLVGNSLFTGNSQIARNRLEAAEQQIRACLRRLEDARNRAHLARTNRNESPDPFHLAARIPGNVAALANDGEFLWLGVDNYFGSYLLLLHKPSLSLVAGHTMGVRERISSVAVSDKYVWAGTAYGDNALLRLRKDAFLSVPRNQWVSIVVTPEERQRIVRGMSKTDQALYAFYAGDDERVVQLLGELTPEQAGLQEMLLLAWSFDASGVDDPDQSRAWSDRIRTRYPDSPWATVANEGMKENELRRQEKKVRALQLAKFDRNHDGVLDDEEKRAMAKDPQYAQEEQKLVNQQAAAEMDQVVKRYDRDGDARLDLEELRSLRQAITLYLHAKETLGSVPQRKRVLDPLLNERTPSAEEMLKRYDTDHDQKLSAAELSALAVALRKH